MTTAISLDRTIELRTGDMPSVLWIELTSKCPFDCIFCTRRSLRGDGVHMDFDLYRSIVGELVRPSVLRLNYSGESTHHPRIIEAIELAAATGAVTELVSAFATFPERQMERFVRSGLDRLTISLHTLDDQQFRGVYRHMSLDDMKRKIEHFLRVRAAAGSEKPSLDFAVVAMQRNLDQLPRIADYAESLGVRQLFVHPVISRDPLPVRFDDELEDGVLKPPFVGALSRTVAEIAARHPRLKVDFSRPEVGALHELDRVPRYFPGPLPDGARIHSCDQDPWDTVHILANGDVVVCEVRDKIVLGNVRERTLREIWQGEEYRRFRQDYVNGRAAECRTCPYKIAYRPADANGTISLDAGMDPGLLRGWYPAEPGIVWSMGRSLATLVPRRPAGALRIEGILPPANGGRNELVVEADGTRIGTIVNESPEMLRFDTALPFGAPATSALTCTFETATTYRPAEHGAEDSRGLGFALRRLELVDHAGEAPARPPRDRFAELRRALRMTRLSATLRIARATLWLAGRVPRRRRPAVSDWRPGLSIVVPERANPVLLSEALEHADRAARATGEPFELIVVVNGSPLADYRDPMRRFPDARWLHADEPLSFASAIARGLREARYDGVYLLNNDMVLADDALVKLLPWRAPNVFAIASQIFFVDPQRRREETGWTDFELQATAVSFSDVVPDEDGFVRSHPYAGGGSSLFRRAYLERLLNRRDPYAPFYCEDAEWGIRAWREGYEVLFCPGSRVRHHHRATISRFFAPADVDRIRARNEMQFLLRNLLGATDVRAFLDVVRDGEGTSDLTRRELTSIRNSLAIAGAQWHAGRAPCADAPLRFLRRKYYPPRDPESAAKPVLLLASPYAVYPPAHGGAIRIAELLRTLAAKYRVVLLSDEERLYTPESTAHFAGLDAVHLVGGRPAERAEDVGRRIPRILNHTHAGFRAELRRLLVSYEPEIVQIEYVELAAAVAERRNGAAWFLTLHDVLFTPETANEDDRFERGLLEKYDAAVVCSAEDAALVRGLRTEVVPNGTRLAAVPYVPSRGNTEILFAGPFRYTQNLEGIRAFLELVYPGLKRAVPQVRLVVLGGDGAPETARTMACFDQPGVEVRDYVPDVAPLLERCALTINPQYAIRGSSIKLIESIAAGRVCVSTRDGARGFLDRANPALIVVDRIEEFAAPLERLLLDERYRLTVERPDPAMREASSWAASANRLLDVYRRRHANGG
ncbi:MAG TPA: SPASM domain-containing protein [Candidatus Elarobacter sp.]|jgi:MoaA/NifB/PqqE/SkfB family radical SAM enzyme/GT2 family glycosyltransferase|nr:SPASM domain-containing protein [Candidatus Elarobacter sp.]